MKEITRIHLARVAYDIEITAKKQLETYLEAVQKALDADDDTMSEIEARIVEILASRGVQGDDIVTADDVTAVKSQLGDPSEFVDDTVGEHEASEPSSRRLMRSTDNAIFGGVCGGIGEFFDLNVTGLRWVAIALTIMTGGALIPVYIALWIILRPAKSAADRLQLRGETVTPAAMKRLVEQEKGIMPEGSQIGVLVLRALLTIGFSLAALGALVLTVGSVVTRPLLFVGHDAYGYSGWIIAAGVLAVLAGVLFIVLMVLAAIVSARWKITRRSILSAAVITFIGLMSFGLAVTVGGYSLGRANTALDAAAQNLMVTKKVSDVPLAVGKSLTITSPLTASGVEYHVTNDKPHAVIQYLSGQARPRIVVDKTNAVTIKMDGECHGSMTSYCMADTTVILYGPEVEALTAQSGAVRYYAAKQSKLSVSVQPDASLIVGDGRIDTLSGSVSVNGSVSVEDPATISSVDLHMAASSYGSFSSLDNLSLTVPEMCSDDVSVFVDVRALNTLTVNGHDTSLGDLNSRCLQLNQN